MLYNGKLRSNFQLCTHVFLLQQSTIVIAEAHISLCPLTMESLNSPTTKGNLICRRFAFSHLGSSQIYLLGAIHAMRFKLGERDQSVLVSFVIRDHRSITGRSSTCRQLRSIALRPFRRRNTRCRYSTWRRMSKLK